MTEKAPKYGNTKVERDGRTFDSKLEADRYDELVLLERAGVIRSLVCQPKFMLEVNGRPVLIKSDGYPNGRKASYTADFQYFDVERHREVVEDCKGFDTSGSRLRRAIVEAMLGIEIVLIKAKKPKKKRKRFRWRTDPRQK